MHNWNTKRRDKRVEEIFEVMAEGFLKLMTENKPLQIQKT